MNGSLGRRTVAEFLGTGSLVAAVVGSGIMAERLAGGNVGLALLMVSIATGGALLALICTFAPISGAHLNPVVSLVEAVDGHLAWSELPYFCAAQISGGIAGTIATNIMFGLAAVSWSRHARGGGMQLASEFLVTLGLVCVIRGAARLGTLAVAASVAGYITAAIMFTVSTSFANPAVTIARVFTDTFTGVRAPHVPAFVVMQIAGGIAAAWLFRWLLANSEGEKRDAPRAEPSEADD